MLKDIDLICKLNKEWLPDNIKIKKAGGQTNRNYIIQCKGRKFFVRLPWEKGSVVNRKIEANNILALQGNSNVKSILPEYYVFILNGRNVLQPKNKEIFDLPDGAMMTEYIEGEDIDGKDLEKARVQQELLKTLYTFHNSHVRFVNKYDVFRDEVSKYRKKAKRRLIKKLINLKRIKTIEDIENKVKEKLTLGGKISTHNDLIFENLRLGKDGKIYLLDFEYSGFNIRGGIYYDLGIILGGNLFQKNPIKLKTFNEILNKAKKIYKKDLNNHKIYCGALANILVMFWWGVIRYFSVKTRKEKDYFKQYILKRAEGIEFLYNIIKRK